MTLQKRLSMKVHYYPDRIELSGDAAAIHTEADRILVCFRFSAHPYQLDVDSDRLVVLRSTQEEII